RELLEDSHGHCLAPLPYFTYGSDTRWTSGIAPAGSQQTGRLLEEVRRHAVERSALPDPPGIGVIEVQVGLELLETTRDLFGERHTEVPRIAHEEQGGHSPQSVAQAGEAALLLGGTEVTQCRQEFGRKVEPEGSGVHLLLGHGKLA